jgi:predicted NAD/FAD-binding protein
VRIAVVGSGIAGLVCAHLLARHHDVVIFESQDRPGGHAHTVTVTVDGKKLAVDTGFLVYNERTYPGLVRLFDQLGIATQASDMSFSVVDDVAGLEYCGTSPSTVFAQRKNLWNPTFVRMLVDVARFNRTGQKMLKAPPRANFTVADMLAHGRWSTAFREWYLIPLGSSIWSADPTTFAQMPLTTLLQFFDRHGLLALGDRPTWRTVSGGSVHYVEALLTPFRAAGRLHLSTPVEQIRRTDEGVELIFHGQRVERYDHVVVATHSDEALRMLANATPEQKEVLGDISYQSNRVTLHTDARLMPKNRRVWAAWNYHRSANVTHHVTMTYYLNQLQALDTAVPLLVTLNRDNEIDPAAVLETFEYSHPVLDATAVRAQARHGEISGRDGISFCGAYWASGFHEDGLQSAVAVCATLGVEW